jgi:hypothetical protein
MNLKNVLVGLLLVAITATVSFFTFRALRSEAPKEVVASDTLYNMITYIDSSVIKIEPKATIIRTGPVNVERKAFTSVTSIRVILSDGKEIPSRLVVSTHSQK